MTKTKTKNKFYLHVGDWVIFKDLNGNHVEGEVLARPHGRRLFGIVRDNNGQVHYVPTRDRFLKVVYHV